MSLRDEHGLNFRKKKYWKFMEKTKIKWQKEEEWRNSGLIKVTKKRVSQTQPDQVLFFIRIYVSAVLE